MEMKLTRSHRKTLSLRINPAGELEVRAPMGMPLADIQRMVKERAQWIETHRAQVLRERAQAEPLDEAAILELKEETLTRLTPILERQARAMGVQYGKVTVRCQRTRWGSCAENGNLSFNCLLALAPESVLEYVAIHELAHRKQMNHSAAFWQEVYKVCPDFRTQRAWLKDHGGELLARVR